MSAFKDQQNIKDRAIEKRARLTERAEGVKFGFTAGNWEVMPGNDQPRICVESDPEWPIVIVSSGPSVEEAQRNERLIARAPKMLRLIYHGLKSGVFNDAPVFKRDAIKIIFEATWIQVIS